MASGSPSGFGGTVPVPAVIIDLAVLAWGALHRLSAYALLNGLDDPAILAIAFC